MARTFWYTRGQDNDECADFNVSSRKTINYVAFYYESERFLFALPLSGGG